MRNCSSAVDYISNSFHNSAKIKCGAIVRLTHYTTKKNLHTHLHRSPLSGNQEVSCFGDSGEGDAGVCVFINY